MSIKYTYMVLYDIPNNSKEESRKYTRFRKKILTEGFYQLQESVYVKPIYSISKATRLRKELEILSPLGSNIRGILFTENIFNKMEVISGELSFEEKIVKKSIKIIEI